MMSRALKLSFLKVLAAVAGADGIVESDERNRIKVLFNGFDLDDADRREVDALLDRPVSFERAIELTKEFAGRVAPPRARRELLSEIETLLGEEADRTSEERELLGHVRSILASHTVVDGIVDRFRGLFAKKFPKRGASDGAGALVVDRTRNAALARVAERFRDAGRSLEGRSEEWNRATLVGVLLAHVARVDGRWTDGERAVLERTLGARLDLDETARAVVFAAMDEEAAADPDLQRVCSEASRLTTMPERIEILEALFEAALADGSASKAEVEEIRRIADLLWISRPEYLAVRDRVRDRIEP